MFGVKDKGEIFCNKDIFICEFCVLDKVIKNYKFFKLLILLWFMFCKIF